MSIGHVAARRPPPEPVVCYLLLVEAETVYFLTIFAKNEKANLSPAERGRFRKWVEVLRHQHRKSSEP